ncbi:unnamed protein product [Effrenium voratum]|nr:unnamed protein product [Effrenium voratum]
MQRQEAERLAQEELHRLEEEQLAEERRQQEEEHRRQEMKRQEAERLKQEELRRLEQERLAEERRQQEEEQRRQEMQWQEAERLKQEELRLEEARLAEQRRQQEEQALQRERRVIGQSLDETFAQLRQDCAKSCLDLSGKTCDPGPGENDLRRRIQAEVWRGQSPEKRAERMFTRPAISTAAQMAAAEAALLSAAAARKASVQQLNEAQPLQPSTRQTPGARDVIERHGRGEGLLGDDHYVLGKALGTGAFCTVYLAECKKTGNPTAVKVFERAAEDGPETAFRNERRMLQLVSHPNVISLLDAFEDAHCCQLVVELCDGGELFDTVVEVGRITEKQTAHLMRQICSPLAYMHQQLVCHRDLKPEHFLLARRGPLDVVPLKLIDFGLATSFVPGTKLLDSPGTVMYVAPEVLTQSYQPPACDLWSFGVVMFLMLSGINPFDADTAKQVAKNVRKASFSFSAGSWEFVSEGCKDLIRQLLEKDAARRLSAAEALQHSWLRSLAPDASAEPLPIIEQLGRWVKDSGLPTGPSDWRKFRRPTSGFTLRKHVKFPRFEGQDVARCERVAPWPGGHPAARVAAPQRVLPVPFRGDLWQGQVAERSLGHVRTLSPERVQCWSQQAQPRLATPLQAQRATSFAAIALPQAPASADQDQLPVEDRLLRGSGKAARAAPDRLPAADHRLSARAARAAPGRLPAADRRLSARGAEPSEPGWFLCGAARRTTIQWRVCGGDAAWCRAPGGPRAEESTLPRRRGGCACPKEVLQDRPMNVHSGASLGLARLRVKPKGRLLEPSFRQLSVANLGSCPTF